MACATLTESGEITVSSFRTGASFRAAVTR